MVIAREQRRTRDAAIRLSTIDPLTGLFNRTFFFAAVEREIARCARSGRGLLPADDGSRRPQGDQRPARATSTATGCCAASARSSPRASAGSTPRPATAATSSSCSCPRPTRPAPSSWPRRSGSASTRWRSSCPSGGPHPSLSIGVVSYPDDGRTADELMISADDAMYTSKRAGKDRVTGVSMPVADRPTAGPRRPAAAAVDDSGVASPAVSARPSRRSRSARPRLLDPSDSRPRRARRASTRRRPACRSTRPPRSRRRRRRARAGRSPTPQPGYAYSRISNPTTTALGDAYAELAGGEAGLALASGMGAIHAALASRCCGPATGSWPRSRSSTASTSSCLALVHGPPAWTGPTSWPSTARTWRRGRADARRRGPAPSCPTIRDDRLGRDHRRLAGLIAHRSRWRSPTTVRARRTSAGRSMVARLDRDRRPSSWAATAT